jgi:heme/copper-type cytochrome/quinol oxidase subunit 2
MLFQIAKDWMWFWWENILIAWRIGHGLFSWIEGVSVVVAAALLLSQKGTEHREGWEHLSMKVAIIVLILTFVISTILIAPFVQYDRVRSKTDLRMNLINYFYDWKSGELCSDLQFINHGKGQRTVLNVGFFYRDADNKNAQHPLDVRGMNIVAARSPVDVEHGKPVLRSYRYKLEDTSLTLKEGTVFGIQITTLKEDGSMNFTTVEAMIATNVSMDKGDKHIAWLSSSRKNISLDDTLYLPIDSAWEHIKDFRAAQPASPTQLSPTPNKEASPH